MVGISKAGVGIKQSISWLWLLKIALDLHNLIPNNWCSQDRLQRAKELVPQTYINYMLVCMVF